MDIPRLIIGIVALLVSVILHEIMHAWSALKLGDPTGRDDGRITLNPVPHIDPWMTFVMPILFYLSIGIPFGGAKPVRINPLNFRDPGRGYMISAAAGPLTNFGLAIVSFGLLFALYKLVPSLVFERNGSDYNFTFNGLFFAMMIYLNLLLGAFNLIPVPPLDGSRVLRYFLPEAGKQGLDRMEPFGLLIVIGLIYVGATRYFLWPFLHLLGLALTAVFPGGFVEGFQRVFRGD